MQILQLFDHYYDNDAQKALPIAELRERFSQAGNEKLNAATSQEDTFDAAAWNGMSAKQQDDVLMNYRLAYRNTSYVNCCEALGTVLANDEVKGDKYQSYFNLPENQKLFFDVIIRNVASNDGELVDVAIQYEETLKDEELLCVPRIAKVGSLEEYFGHKEIDGGQNQILINNTGKIANSLTIINDISINGVDFVDKIAVS